MKTVADGISDRQWTAYRTGVVGGCYHAIIWLVKGREHTMCVCVSMLLVGWTIHLCHACILYES